MAKKYCVTLELVERDELEALLSRGKADVRRLNGVQTLFITPGSPWENGNFESFNGKLGDELLKREWFDTLTEAKVLIER